MGFRVAFHQILIVGCIVATIAAVTRIYLAHFERTDLSGLRVIDTITALGGNGTRVELVTSASESSDGSSSFRVLALNTSFGFYPERPGSWPKHLHKNYSEQLVVRSGVLGYHVKGANYTAQEGQSVIFAPGAAHTWWVHESVSEVELDVVYTPGAEAETMMRAMAGLTLDYGGTDKIFPAQVLVTLLSSGTNLAEFPGFAQQLLEKAMVPAFTLVGFQPTYPQYQYGTTPVPDTAAGLPVQAAEEEAPASRTPAEEAPPTATPAQVQPAADAAPAAPEDTPEAAEAAEPEAPAAEEVLGSEASGGGAAEGQEEAAQPLGGHDLEADSL